MSFWKSTDLSLTSARWSPRAAAVWAPRPEERVLIDKRLNEEGNMRITSLFTVGIACAISGLLAGLGLAWAAVGLDTYVDENGFIDVQTLTCDQLANTYQEDANALANWYSGWYNGLAKKHFYHLSRVAGVEHELIVWCEAHREKRIIEVWGSSLMKLVDPDELRLNSKWFSRAASRLV